MSKYITDDIEFFSDSYKENFDEENSNEKISNEEAVLKEQFLGSNLNKCWCPFINYLYHLESENIRV